MCEHEELQECNLIDNPTEFHQDKDIMDMLGSLESIVGNILQDNISSIVNDPVIHAGFHRALHDENLLKLVENKLNHNLSDIHNVLQGELSEDEINDQIFIAYIHSLIMPTVENDGFHPVDVSLLSDFALLIEEFQDKLPETQEEEIYDVTVVQQNTFTQSLFTKECDMFFIENSAIIDLLKDIKNTQVYIIVRTLIGDKVYITACEYINGAPVSVSENTLIELYGDLDELSERMIIL